MTTITAKHSSLMVSLLNTNVGEYKALRKELQQQQTPSARKRLKQIGQRENRYVTDVNHQVTKALIENNPKGTVFVLEDLTGVRQVVAPHTGAWIETSVAAFTSIYDSRTPHGCVD